MDKPDPIDRHLEPLLLRERGDNRALVAEIKAKLSPEAKERLFRVLQTMQGEIDEARRRRWWPPGTG